MSCAQDLAEGLPMEKSHCSRFNMVAKESRKTTCCMRLFSLKRWNYKKNESSQERGGGRERGREKAKKSRKTIRSLKNVKKQYIRNGGKMRHNSERKSSSRK